MTSYGGTVSSLSIRPGSTLRDYQLLVAREREMGNFPLERQREDQKRQGSNEDDSNRDMNDRERRREEKQEEEG